MAENSVDFGHFAEVHRYENIQPIEPLEVDGAVLRASYRFTRPRGLAGKGRLTAEIAIHQRGLGYALVEVNVTSMQLRTRQLVLTQPEGGDRVALRIGMAVDKRLAPARIHPLLALFPTGWLAERIADQGIRGYRADVAQDVPIWQNKVHLERPALADGDGPIGVYRKWARQFYAPPG